MTAFFRRLISAYNVLFYSASMVVSVSGNGDICLIATGINNKKSRFILGQYMIALGASLDKEDPFTEPNLGDRVTKELNRGGYIESKIIRN